MKQRFVKSPIPSSDTSIYEAIGKMLLDNMVQGRNPGPCLGTISSSLGSNDPDYEKLLEKPLWQFTGKDHAYMMKHILMESFSSENEAEPSSQKHYVQGIQGIATLFGCSRSTAQRIKKSGIIDKAITQVQRKILVDADLALQLVKDSGHKVSEL